MKSERKHDTKPLRYSISSLSFGNTWKLTLENKQTNIFRDNLSITKYVFWKTNKK